MWLDCIPCILRVALSAIRNSTSDHETERKLFYEALRIIKAKPLNVTSPEVIRDILVKIEEYTGCSDPFEEIKVNLNREGLRLYPQAKEEVQNSPNPLYLATKKAIAANKGDVMTTPKLVENEDPGDLPQPDFLKFKEKLEKADLLVYLGDNAGEIVFDKILVEEILRSYDTEIVFVVRSQPALNDATLDDASLVGMDRIVEVIDNGINEPLPGTLVDKVSKRLKNLLERADVIISKGGGNFETLANEDLSICFMLVAKCHPLANFFNIPYNSLVLRW
jgi:hypothetical protein